MRNQPRAGYSLLEVVLVMAILVILAAVSYPTLDGMQDEYRMAKAVDEVRGAWDIAQAHAIDEGRPYQFAVSLDKGTYRICPENTDSGKNRSNGDGTTDASNPEDKVLPKGIRFVDISGSPANGSPTDDDSTPPESVNPDNLKQIAVFLPDGTARDDAVIAVQGRSGSPMVLRLRALTGDVTAGPWKKTRIRHDLKKKRTTGWEISGVFATREVAAGTVRAKRHGLTLLEVLAAMAIFLLGWVALLQVVRQASDQATDVQMENKAALLCQSKLNELAASAQLDPGETSGKFESERVPWQVSDTDDDNVWGWTAQVNDVGQAGLLTIKVVVSRQHPDGSRIESSLAQMVLNPSLRGSTRDSQTSSSSGSRRGSSSGSSASPAGSTGGAR